MLVIEMEDMGWRRHGVCLSQARVPRVFLDDYFIALFPPPPPPFCFAEEILGQPLPIGTVVVREGLIRCLARQEECRRSGDGV